jgi:hypothetical protein
VKSRLATIMTLVALVGGTGGALAVANSGSGNHGSGSAATGQYRPGHGCGDKNHQHTKGCPPPHHHKPKLKSKHKSTGSKGSHHKSTGSHHKNTKSHGHSKSKHH